MDKTKYQEIGRAELKVDCYTGPCCNQHKPEWHGFFDGDMDGGKIADGQELNLASTGFPPGTKVTISVPVCPECGTQREMCACGFNWRGWDEQQYA